MDLPPATSLLRGKREAEDAIGVEVVSSKKQKVDENVSEIEIENETAAIELEKNANTSFEVDASCSKPDQLIKVKVSGEDEHVVSVLEDKSNALEEDTGAANTKPACAAKEGHIAVSSVIDESNVTRLNADVAATIKTPASLIEEDLAAPSKKKGESREDSDCFSKRETILDEDVTATNLSPPEPSTEKSLVSLQKNDDSRTREFDSTQIHSTHDTNTDDNVAPAKKAPPAPTEKGSVVSWKKDDESCSDAERFDKVAAETTSSNLTKEEDEANEELELDDVTSSSDDDQHQTPATPTDQTTGGKTLFVGNLSFSVEQEDVEDFFKGTGEVVDIRFAMNSDETFKGYGYVKFASAEAAKKALHELNGKELLRRRVRLDIMKERGFFTPYTGSQDTESFQKAGKAQGKTVFVRGFNKSDCQDEIRKSLEEHFGSCGEISRVSIPKDQDGCARGIAYIDFKDRDAFAQALALNGSEFREGILSVKEAMPRGDSSAGSGRGYGRREFGGRSGWHDFGGRSGLRDFNGSGVRETGAWFGAGVWQTSSGRSAWQNSSGRGVWQNSSGRGDWQNSSGRGDWQNSSGRGVWQNSSGRGDLQNSSGRGDWQKSSGRGVWHNSNYSGRGDWHNSNYSGRGDLRNSSGRGDWQKSSGSGVWHNSNYSGRGDWHNSNYSGRGDWQNSNSSGRGDWQISKSSGRGDWQNSNSSGRVDWHNSNSSGRGDWQHSSGRGVWQNFNERGVRRDFSGRGTLGNVNGRAGVRGTGVWFGGGREQGTPIKPSIAEPGAGNNTTFNNEG